MELDARLTLSGDPRSPAEARRFVARTLTTLVSREDVETAMLLTSELVTNAMLHAGSSCEVSLRAAGDLLHIRVSDLGGRTAMRRSISDQVSAGRGLRLLEVLCRRWGVDAGPDGGKTVWCDLHVSG